MSFSNLEEVLKMDLEFCCRDPNRDRKYDVTLETFEDALNDNGVIINSNPGPQANGSFEYRMKYEGMTLVVVTSSKIEFKGGQLVYQD